MFKIREDLSSHACNILQGACKINILNKKNFKKWLFCMLYTAKALIFFKLLFDAQNYESDFDLHNFN